MNPTLDMLIASAQRDELRRIERRGAKRRGAKRRR
jgi:hypothetical protein